jgi:hypothetical protein
MEWLGIVGGHAAGVSFFLLGLIRRSRPFHAQGVVFRGEVSSDCLPSQVLVRFSSGWWKYREWPDILGLALRFNDSDDLTERRGAQDLLFISVSSLMKIPVGFLLTKYKNFLSNTYFAITPFSINGEVSSMRVICDGGEVQGESRLARIKQAVSRGDAKLTLQTRSQGDWQTVAEISSLSLLNVEHEKLLFTPFNTARGIRPLGFVNYLRLGGYQWSQASRQ